jgi:hypothetical protein
MANFDNLRKQAKLLVRWHRTGNYSVGGRIRSLPRYRNLTDVETLALKFPLSEAQEIIALESGYESWAALKSGLSTMEEKAQNLAGPVLKGALPVVFVSNVQTSAAFFRDRLGFAIDFLHGHPPFYASVSRGAARLHLRFVQEPVIAPGVREREEGLLSALRRLNASPFYVQLASLHSLEYATCDRGSLAIIIDCEPRPVLFR